MQKARHLPSAPLAWIRVPSAGIELWPTVMLLVLYFGVYLQFAIQLAGFPFDLDQGEGYDAWSGWLINLGQLPYTSNAEFPYYSSNYPPLWSYLVSIPMAWIGPGLVAARLVSTLAGLLTAVVLGFAGFRTSGRPVAGALAAGFFLASPYVFHTTPLARVNSLALLAAVVGLAALERPTPRRVLFGSLALAAALFTKPTTVDAVAAGVIFLLLAAPRLGALAISTVAGLGLIGVGLLLLVTHGAFWLNVVAGNANPFDAFQLASYLANFTLVHCVLLAMAAAECVRTLLRRAWSPWPLYGISAGLATLGVGKWGAGESYFLGAIAAICLLSSVWVTRFLDSRPPARLRWGIGGAMIIQALLLAHASVSNVLPWFPDRGPQSAFLGRAPTLEDQQAALGIAQRVQQAPGLVLSEDPSFAVAAGKPLVGNATHLRNLYQAGLWDPTPMVRDLHQRRYAIVILDADLYPEPVLAAIGQSYFLERSVRINNANYQIFLPGQSD